MTTALTKIEETAVNIHALNDMTASWIKFVRKCEKTRKTYDSAIRQWVKYCVDNSINSPAESDIVNFLDSLKAAKKSVSTINLYCSAIRVFYRWTAKENLYPNIADNVKANTKKSYKHKKRALTVTQGKSLIKSVKGESVVALRNKALIALTISAGLRTIEMYRADVGDFENVDGKIYLWIRGKGREEKDERILVASQVFELLAAYLQARGNVRDDEPLFVSTRRNKNNRLSTQSISKMIKRHLKEIGLNDRAYSAHSLRHSAANTMILAGVELRHVQAVLRHRSIVTTMIYVEEVNRLVNQAEQIVADQLFGY